MNVVQKIPFICTFNQSIAILEKSNAVSSMPYVFAVQNRYSIVYPCVKQVESLEPNCVRIIIEGYTSFGIQGVNLREAIEKRIKHPDNGDPLAVVGMVRNLKDGRVEIVCKGPDVGLLYETIHDWDEKRTFEIRGHTKEDHYDPEPTHITDFVVERSDDLSEMVLALRGAGYRFVQSSKTLEKINENILERDRKIALGRLLTLHYEVVENIRELDEPRLDRKKIYLEVFRSNLSSPVIPEQSFAHLLVRIFNELNALQKDDTFSIERLDSLRKDLLKMQETIDDELCQKYGVKM
jgi:acylphosphatase